MKRTHVLSILISAVAVAAALFAFRSIADTQEAKPPLTPGQQADSLLPFLDQEKQAQKGEAPVQPITEFSHKIHAGDNHIPCLYCHIGADKSPVARVPAVSTCMGCHKLVGTDKPGIIKLTQYWNRQQAIPWVKVNDIPDHVRFTHKRHIDAGIACQTCHGEIQTEDHVKLAHTLNMGFCVTCHKARLNDPVHATSLDCATCHK